MCLKFWETWLCFENCMSGLENWDKWISYSVSAIEKNCNKASQWQWLFKKNKDPRTKTLLHFCWKVTAQNKDIIKRMSALYWLAELHESFGLSHIVSFLGGLLASGGSWYFISEISLEVYGTVGNPSSISGLLSHDVVHWSCLLRAHVFFTVMCLLIYSILSFLILSFLSLLISLKRVFLLCWSPLQLSE